MHVPFQMLKPVYCSKEFREWYQCLQKAMCGASASVGIATAFMSDALNSNKEQVDVIADDLNVICDAKELKIDQRAMLSFSLLLLVFTLAN